MSSLLDYKVYKKPGKYHFYSYLFPNTWKSVLHRVDAKEMLSFKL